MGSGGSTLRRIGHYSLAKIAIMFAGLVSYPILTRVLSPAQYGVMGIIVTILNISIGLSKVGLGETVVVRLWPEWGRDRTGGERFILTGLLTLVLFTVPVVLITDAGTYFLRHAIGEDLARFILLASPLIVIRSFSSFGQAVIQAREWSRARALFEVATTYAAMILAVTGAAAVIRGLRGYYIGLVTGEALVTVVLLIFLLGGIRQFRGRLSARLIRELLTFGLPIVIYELSGALFFTGDRFLIMWLLDAEALGYYTVAFNLANYVNTAFTFPMTMAVGPAVTNLYEKEGPAAASEFLRKAARYFLMFTLAAVAGMTIIREDLMVLLASSAFLPGAAMLHILLAAFLLGGGQDIVGAGLYLKKRPWTMAGLDLAGTSLNATLNLLLLPRLKSLGAAVASLAAQAAMTVVFWIMGSRHVRVPLDLPALLLHLMCAAAMAVTIHFVDPGPGALRLILRLVVGVAVYGGLVLALDREARTKLFQVLNRRGED